MRKKLLFIVAVLLFLVLIAAGGAYVYFIRLPLPVKEGELRLRGLRDSVTVYRDRWGVPHIFAENEHDLFMAQGFVQAQDRLWQMETNRRIAAGRLSEIFGPEAVEVDRVLRSFGFMRAARAELSTYDAATLEILHAFSRGVNAFIEGQGGRLPFEFKALSIHPEPWKPEDSVGWGKFMGHTGGKNWQEELVRALLRKELGEEKTDDLLRRIQPPAPAPIPADLQPDSVESPLPLSKAGTLPAFGGGSNNWVVHGSRSTTGLPLLANDMHLALTVPSVFYEMHLAGGGLDVIGLSLPGVPLIIAGHNRNVAWGITFAYTDGQDLFLERFDREKGGRYLFRGEWLEPRLLREEIKVRGQKEPVLHEIRVTNHGPVISPLIEQAEGMEHAFALRWSGHDPGTTTSVLYRMNRAGNWDEFRAAAAEWCEPPVNLVYADTLGNIGYVLGSRIPIRSQGHGMGPFPGWTGDSEWTGYVGPEEKPFVLNPEDGYFATANNDVVGKDFPFYLAGDYASDNRVNRIVQVLSGKNPISKEEFGELQGDLRSLSAAPFVDAVRRADIRDPEATELQEILIAWDQTLSPESAGGAVYSVSLQRLLENTFKDELGPLTGVFLGIGLIATDPLNRFAEHSRTILQGLMSEPDSPWFDDIDTPEREELSETVEKSLVETAAFLKGRLGPDPSTWRWGQLHTVEMKHLLGREPLDTLLNAGPYEVGGDFSTVWQSSIVPGMDFRLQGWSAANRHIYNLKDWDGSLGAIVPGQSGVPRSPHYDDQVDLWLKAAHHPLYFTRSKVESEAAARLVLRPAGGRWRE
jgi:penicillin amidase